MIYNIQRKRPVTFSRFTRKGYALFSCLGREVRIGVLSVATLATATPALRAQEVKTAPAQPAVTSEHELDEATARSLRPLTVQTEAVRQVAVIRRADLSAAGVSTLNDALKLAVGIDVRQRGGFGIQTDISIDGGTYDQMALYVNGIPYNNPQTGHNAADFPFTLDDVERIEVLEGAASRLFGSQAFSGAVNVVLRSDGPSVARLQAGSYGTLLADARGAFSLGRYASSSLSARYQRSDGAVKNGDFKGGSLFWQGRYERSLLALHWQAGATLKDFGANTFYSAAYDNQWEATRRYSVALAGDLRTRVRLQPKLSWVRSTDHYLLKRDNPAFYENFNRTDVTTLGLKASAPWALGQTTAGAELSHEHLLSRNLGFDRAQDDWVKIPHQDLYYNRGANRTHLNLSLEHEVRLDRWTLSLGAFGQRSSLGDKRFRLLGGVDLSYRLSPSWRLFASWNQAMRQPTFTDLWYRSPTHEGNGALRPERNNSLRVGADYVSSLLSFQGKLFYLHGRDMIDWVQYAAGGKWSSSNFKMNSYGASFTARLDVTALWGSRQPFRELTLGYAYIDQDRLGGTPIYKANYAFEYFRHKLIATLTHRIVADLSASWNFRLQRREGGYEEYLGGTATGRLLPYGTHAQLDCRLSWEKPRYSLTLDMTNLTAHRYYDYGNVRQAGFFIMAGAAYRF